MEDVTYSMKKEMLRRKLSLRTIESYCFCVKKFFKQCRKEPRKITKKDVKDYLDNLALRNKAGSTLNIHLSAIKFLLEDVLRRNINLDMKFSRRPKTLPTVLNKSEVKMLIGTIKNPKHNLMIQLMYSAGLRLSELLHLKVKDFEFENNFGWVRAGKGNKDRPFILAESLRKMISDFVRNNDLKPNDYLFKGPKGHMHQRSVQEIIRKARKKAKIMKNVHPHTLRHSFATHLIEDGYNVTDVQPLLGHTSVKTTEMYLHIAAPRILSVRSPLDTL
jgi:site-specific recombinase XerD